MIQKIIQISQMELALIAFTPMAQSCLMNFLSSLPAGDYAVTAPSYEVKWKLYLLAADTGSSKPEDFPDGRLKLWRNLYQASLSFEKGEAGSFFSIQTELNQEYTEFIHFMASDSGGEEERAVLLAHLARIVERWMMVKGNISLHASTIVNRKHGFLFLGSSGAGKSTVALLSRERASVVHDEKIFLTPEDGGYALSKIPHSTEMNEAAKKNALMIDQLDGDIKIYLSGIFVLKQDTKNFLVPMQSMKIAHALINSYLELPRIFTLSHQELRYSMSVLSKVAREIPAYEMHFRKSPDFWELIDERFPD